MMSWGYDKIVCVVIIIIYIISFLWRLGGVFLSLLVRGDNV